MEPHVVVMVEPALPGETLTLTQQINEVFGPFDTGDDADSFVTRMRELIPNNRLWLIIPLSSPAVANLLDPRVN